MFKHLLVPLDGSPSAECALPAAAQIAARNGAAISLLHVLERDAPAEVHGVRHLRTADEAKAYLGAVAQRLAAQGVTADVHVHAVAVEDVARGIADHLLELNQDTVVMSTHGGGLRTRLFGSMAQQAVALGRMPVLLVRPGAEGAGAPPAMTRVLLPHDGVPEHEPALPAGIEFARLLGAALHLVLVVPTRGTLSGSQRLSGHALPRAAAAMLELATEEAEAHLRRHVEQLRGEGLEVTAQVRRGDPAEAIALAAAVFCADVIVLGTHGKAGTRAFWSVSTAARVAARSDASLLFVPVGEARHHAETMPVNP